jgi:hypothetical protein
VWRIELKKTIALIRLKGVKGKHHVLTDIERRESFGDQVIDDVSDFQSDTFHCSKITLPVRNKISELESIDHQFLACHLRNLF